MRHALHVIWRVVKPLGEVVLALLVLLLAVLIPTLAGSTGAVKDNLGGVVVAANATGPLTGDQSVIPKEVSCMKTYAADPANNYANYLPAIGAPEHTDAIHSGTQPCATFTGSLGGNNQVFQYQSQTTWPDGVQFVVFDGPNAGYVQGGGLGSPSSGQYVAKFNPSTGQEIWRTYLTNVNVTNQWIAFGSIAILPDGSIANAAGPDVWRLDPDTGDVLAHQQQPILGQPATDANFDGFQVAPDKRGTILLKTQTRSTGCPTQGNGAMSSCTSQYGKQPDTTVIAADPKTLKNIDAIKLNQEVTARPIVTTHHGKIYMYISGTTTLVRVIWDPKTGRLTQDKSWAPKYLLKGQEVGDAPALIGNWVIANTNAAPSKTTPICAVAVNQDNPNDVHRLCPWGKKLPVNGASQSESPGSFGTDPENSMLYVQDMLVGGVYGIHLDQGSGQMKVVWKRPDWRTSDYFSLVGPANHRVLISQYFEPGWKSSDLAGDNYTESVLWANAATGKTLAQSGYNPSTALGSLANLGYGGRVYMMGNDGSLFIYQAEPKSSGSSG